MKVQCSVLQHCEWSVLNAVISIVPLAGVRLQGRQLSGESWQHISMLTTLLSLVHSYLPYCMGTFPRQGRPARYDVVR